MTATYGIAYPKPETINPIFSPAPFFRAYKQVLDEAASVDAIQTGLDVIAEEVAAVAIIFDGVGSIGAIPSTTTWTYSTQGAYLVLTDFYILPLQVFSLNYSFKMTASTLTGSSKVTNCMIQLWNYTDNVAEQNYYFWHSLDQKTGDITVWYMSAMVLNKNLSTTVQKRYQLRIVASYAGFASFVISGANGSGSTLPPSIQFCYLTQGT
jgi:hypothetical protein